MFWTLNIRDQVSLRTECWSSRAWTLKALRDEVERCVEMNSSKHDFEVSKIQCICSVRNPERFTHLQLLTDPPRRGGLCSRYLTLSLCYVKASGSQLVRSPFTQPLCSLSLIVFESVLSSYFAPGMPRGDYFKMHEYYWFQDCPTQRFYRIYS